MLDKINAASNVIIEKNSIKFTVANVSSMKKIPVRKIVSTLNEVPNSEQFKIRKVQDLIDREDLFHELHRHDFYFIIALQKGAGMHEIDFTTYDVLDNSVFFMRPGQVHQLQLKNDSTGYIIEFNTDFYRPKDKTSVQRFLKASNKNYCKPEKKRFEKLLGQLNFIFQEYIGREEGYMDAIRANLEIFFIEYIRQSPNPGSPSTNGNTYTQERFEEFSDLLDKHITTHKQVSQYTDLMNLSAYQLNEITKSSVGKTASELINEQIILEAKRNLVATAGQIKEIAGELGYEDVSYFIRFFKKQTGYTPEAFRNNLK